MPSSAVAAWTPFFSARKPMTRAPMGVDPWKSRELMLITRPRRWPGVTNCRRELLVAVYMLLAKPRPIIRGMVRAHQCETDTARRRLLNDAAPARSMTREARLT